MKVLLEHDGWWKLIDIAPRQIESGMISLMFYKPLQYRDPSETSEIDPQDYLITFRRDTRTLNGRLVFRSGQRKDTL